MKKKKNLPKKVGTALAHVQHTMDKVMTWGFKNLKDAGASKSKKNDHKAKKYTKKGAKFIGAVGHSFYEEYEKLKGEDNNVEE